MGRCEMRWCGVAMRICMVMMGNVGVGRCGDEEGDVVVMGGRGGGRSGMWV